MMLLVRKGHKYWSQILAAISLRSSCTTTIWPASQAIDQYDSRALVQLTIWKKVPMSVQHFVPAQAKAKEGLVKKADAKKSPLAGSKRSREQPLTVINTSNGKPEVEEVLTGLAKRRK